MYHAGHARLLQLTRSHSFDKPAVQVLYSNACFSTFKLFLLVFYPNPWKILSFLRYPNINTPKVNALETFSPSNRKDVIINREHGSFLLGSEELEPCHVILAQSNLIPSSVFNLQDSHFSPAADIKGRGNRDEVITVKSRPSRRFARRKVHVLILTAGTEITSRRVQRAAYGRTWRVIAFAI